MKRNYYIQIIHFKIKKKKLHLSWKNMKNYIWYNPTTNACHETQNTCNNNTFTQGKSISQSKLLNFRLNRNIRQNVNNYYPIMKIN